MEGKNLHLAKRQKICEVRSEMHARRWEKENDHASPSQATLAAAKQAATELDSLERESAAISAATSPDDDNPIEDPDAPLSSRQQYKLRKKA